MATSTPPSAARYIYKILPSNPPPPSPLPLALPISPLDARDGFLHFSTSAQVLGTLNNFFRGEDHVWILRVPYERVEKFIKWETAEGKEVHEQGGCWDGEGKWGAFPHVYGNGDVLKSAGEEGTEERALKLGRDEVDAVGKWKKGGESWGKEGWPFESDVPFVAH